MKKGLKIGIYIVVGLAIFGIGYGAGSSNTATLNGKAMTAQQLDQQIASAQNQLNNLKIQNKTVLDEVANKNQLESQIKDDNTKLDSLKSQLSNMSNQVSNEQTQLSQVTGQVQAAAAAPKYLQAGTFTVGQDIPAGRYQAVPTDSGSNFIVNDDNGTPVVNTILGSDGVPSYTFSCTDGETIQTEAPVKLIPLQ